MLKTAFIRDRVVKLLGLDGDFNGMIAAEINGCICFAADIALPDTEGNAEIYRIAVVPHNWQKNIA